MRETFCGRRSEHHRLDLAEYRRKRHTERSEEKRRRPRLLVHGRGQQHEFAREHPERRHPENGKAADHQTPADGGIAFVITSYSIHYTKLYDAHALGEEYGRRLLYLGHLSAIKEDLTPRENLRFAQRLVGLEAPRAALDEALARLGLAGREDVPARYLSQGQKRRAALARLALSRALPLWILDESYNFV